MQPTAENNEVVQLWVQWLRWLCAQPQMKQGATRFILTATPTPSLSQPLSIAGEDIPASANLMLGKRCVQLFNRNDNIAVGAAVSEQTHTWTKPFAVDVDPIENLHGICKGLHSLAHAINISQTTQSFGAYSNKIQSSNPQDVGGGPRIRFTVRCALSRPCVRKEWDWSKRLGRLGAKQMTLKQRTFYTSTLGGGYSALGDIYHTHATKARALAVTQWKLAVELGDTKLAHRCMIFMAWSDIQSGDLERAAQMISHVIERLPPKDEGLLLLCQAATLKLNKALGP
eukprot:m.64117 g.64117  ORF g.64117 m.64117 type:complete len:285 (+) comp23392_c0_seq1:91-945(+)